MRIIVASGNAHKIKEIEEILIDHEIISYKQDFKDHKEPVEDGDTLEENAYIKANDIKKLYPNYAVIADDSGLFVDALNGAPGVHSARYAGDEHDDDKNNELLIKNLAGKPREASFISSICFIDKEPLYFRGEIRGKILEIPRGSGGFGYDPYFLPDGCVKTFAEMNSEEKNKISHRKRALEKLKNFLEK
ncbi:MAG: RdgB/HAM1 family non-canonical purine NTP pyrophosphatase [Ezakiella sp.]|nr:RdgB/HAM1 family non-canonical purine NTP pyrophosphatase [Ezakiella sp.]